MKKPLTAKVMPLEQDPLSQAEARTLREHLIASFFERSISISSHHDWLQVNDALAARGQSLPKPLEFLGKIPYRLLTGFSVAAHDLGTLEKVTTLLTRQVFRDRDCLLQFSEKRL